MLVPFLVSAAIVPCGNSGGTPCQLIDFFALLTNIYVFIVWNIATPLAILALMIGGIFLLVSAGNPNLMSLGRKIVWLAIIGLVLVFGSYLIIKTILTTLGFQYGF